MSSDCLLCNISCGNYYVVLIWEILVYAFKIVQNLLCGILIFVHVFCTFIDFLFG